MRKEREISLKVSLFFFFPPKIGGEKINFPLSLLFLLNSTQLKLILYLKFELLPYDTEETLEGLVILKKAFSCKDARNFFYLHLERVSRFI